MRSAGACIDQMNARREQTPDDPEVSGMKKYGLLMLLLLTLLLTGCSGSPNAPQAASPTETQPGEAEAGLTIPLDSLSAEPVFVDWEQDGTAMQLIALLDDSGQARLAYNTCQSCAGSPYAFFTYANGLLTCQNCGNQFGLAAVGAVVGGCNPMPVGESRIEDGQVVVPVSELQKAAPAFANWRKF